MLLPKPVAAIIGPMNEQDEPDTMEGYLDLPNTIYSDYLQGWTPAKRHETPLPEVHSAFTAHVSHTVEWHGG